MMNIGNINGTTEMIEMRLGEFRTITREFDNRLKVRLSCYDENKGARIFDLEFDMSNENELYLRVVND